eukprot:746509-Hanusia_phi.AAC.5
MLWGSASKGRAALINALPIFIGSDLDASNSFTVLPSHPTPGTAHLAPQSSTCGPRVSSTGGQQMRPPDLGTSWDVTDHNSRYAAVCDPARPPGRAPAVP